MNISDFSFKYSYHSEQTARVKWISDYTNSLPCVLENLPRFTGGPFFIKSVDVLCFCFKFILCTLNQMGSGSQ